MDLGADSWQTFRYVTFPWSGRPCSRAALLAFALSFDEVVVTTFTAGRGTQTIPIWIFSNYQRTQRAAGRERRRAVRPAAVRSSRCTSRSGSAPTRRRPRGRV